MESTRVLRGALEPPPAHPLSLLPPEEEEPLSLSPSAGFSEPFWSSSALSVESVLPELEPGEPAPTQFSKPSGTQT